MRINYQGTVADRPMNTVVVEPATTEAPQLTINLRKIYYGFNTQPSNERSPSDICRHGYSGNNDIGQGRL